MASLQFDHLLQVRSHFKGYPASERLRRLALDPINLSHRKEEMPQRIATYLGEACGYKLLYGTERVTPEVMQALEELARESSALEKMHQMQRGEVVNFVRPYPCENRSVLHTATRDFFDHPQQSPKAQEAAHSARQELEKLKVFLSKCESEKSFDEMVVIGIGGSDQGPRANYTALLYLLKPGRKVHFVANVDPDDAYAVIKEANLKKTLVAVISKSGTTLETETNEEFFREQFKKAGIDPYKHFVSITMPGTPMDNKTKYAEVFYLFDWIGGRYSTSSMVGGVVLSFAFGVEVFEDFLRGAHAMDRAALSDRLFENLPLLAALLGIWNRNFLKYPTLAVIPYAQALRDYPAHFQQVDMESNGKLIDKEEGKFLDFEAGPVLWGSLGTNAQHSYFQLLHQGWQTVPLFMIGFKESQYAQDISVQGTFSQEKLLANLFAQSVALAIGNEPENPNKFCPGNRPSSILLGEKLTPFAAGALLSFYEHKVAFQGFIWGINSFDQEGVQLGKVIAHQFIDCFAAKRAKKEKSAASWGEAYLKHLESFGQP